MKLLFVALITLSSLVVSAKDSTNVAVQECPDKNLIVCKADDEMAKMSHAFVCEYSGKTMMALFVNGDLVYREVTKVIRAGSTSYRYKDEFVEASLNKITHPRRPAFLNLVWIPLEGETAVLEEIKMTCDR